MTEEAQRGHDALDALIAATSPGYDLNREIERLRSIEAWALSTLPFKDGDEVVIKKNFGPIAPTSGWYRHRGHLVPGATGLVTGITLSRYHQCWLAYFHPDVEWSISDYPTVHVSASSKKDSHLFMMNISQLRKRRDSDHPLIAPEGE